MTTFLRGPETVYRVRLTRAAKNFGVVVTSQPPGNGSSHVSSPASTRTAHGLCGSPGAPQPVPRRLSTASAGCGRPLAARGRVRRRVRQRDPCRRRALHLSLLDRRRHPADVAATQQGGEARRSTSRCRHRYRLWDLPPIDPRSGRRRQHLGGVRGIVRVPTVGLAPGRHRLRLRVSDYQETKNTENVARILPNTHADDHLRSAFRSPRDRWVFFGRAPRWWGARRGRAARS